MSTTDAVLSDRVKGLNCRGRDAILQNGCYGGRSSIANQANNKQPSSDRMGFKKCTKRRIHAREFNVE